MEDLYQINPEYESKDLADHFERLWDEAVRESKKPTSAKSKPHKPNIIYVIYKMFGRGFLPLGIIKFFADIANVVAPLMLQGIIAFIEDSRDPDKRPNIGVGLTYAFVMFCLSMFSSISISFFFQRVSSYGMMV
ncbi:hypothetical protein HDU97_006555 [Phlyctochytrium planicorne]|nr:hypothetical protein HDU97_006555 [Phlyctochytrium planicorne]